MNAIPKQPNRVLYMSHGGGPMPLLGDPGHQGMLDFIDQVRPVLGRPAAIVVVSAHWEETQPAVTAGASPALIYDYCGFPQASYQIRYPAPGEPALAGRLQDLLRGQGIDSRLDSGRGFDHGLFVPLTLLYPDADIPCVQLSLVNHLDPELHLRMGEALASLATDDILLIGSGFSFHNLPAFFGPVTAQTVEANEAFEDWLQACMSDPQLSDAQRRQRLIRWAEAPGARFCHPREEHLLPLHVCYGAAGAPARHAFSMEILGRRASAFLW